MHRTPRIVAIATVAILGLAACGDGADGPASDSAISPSIATQVSDAGVRVVSANEGAVIVADSPDDLVILDVRTPEEFAEGHVEGAMLVDFYEPDFADRLAELDPDVPYVLYCRSGNRSEQARGLMADMGFSDVADIDGGILAWAQAGLPVVTG